MNHHRLKRVILEHGWWVCLLAALAVLIAWLFGLVRGDWTTLLTVIGGLLSASFVLQKQYLDELSLFHELFKDFNCRYAELNDHLLMIVGSGKLDDSKRRQLTDYFNLCAEEYWWYRAGYIPHEVWRSWCRGMLSYIEQPNIKEFWEAEVTQDSYYGLTLERVRGAAKS